MPGTRAGRYRDRCAAGDGVGVGCQGRFREADGSQGVFGQGQGIFYYGHGIGEGSAFFSGGDD